MKQHWAWLAAFVLTSTLVASAKDDAEYERKRSDEAERTAKELAAKIAAEVKTLPDHPWAGSYYYGDGLGVNATLFLAPKGGYLFEWHGCLGLYDRNYGKVSFKNGRIKLTFAFKNERKGFQGIAEELVLVTWGKRTYLVAADAMAEFCNDVNSGDEPRERQHGLCFLRRGDEKKKVTGFPEVPKTYRTRLLKRPIEATITSVKPFKLRPSICDWKFKDTPVVVSAGKDHGAQVGMKLYVVAPDVVEWVTITKVEAKTSEAVMTQCGEDAAGPKTGWQLSTRPRWKPVKNDP